MSGQSVVRDLMERSKAASGVFDVGGDSALREAVAVIEQRCSFDFGRLNPKLQRKSGSSRLLVRFSSLGKDVGAQVNPGSRPVTIEVNSDMRNRPAEEVALMILAEGAHVVDHILLDRHQRRAIYALFHGGKVPEGHDHEHPWFTVGDEPHVHHLMRGHRRHKAESKLERDYFTQVGESFMGGFIAAFTDFTPLPAVLTSKFAHKPTPEVGRGIKRVLG